MKRNFLLIGCFFIGLSLFNCQGAAAEAKKAGFLGQLFNKSPLCPEAENYKKENKLEQAVDTYEACMNTSMSKKQQQQIQKDIDLLKTEIVSRTLEEAASVFKGEQTVANYEKAIRVLNAKKKYDQGDGISSRIDDYNSQIKRLRGQIKEYLETALMEEKKERWGKAVQAVNQARMLDPDNSTITARLANAIEKRDEYFKQLIGSTCSINDYDGATEILKTFKAEQPAPSESVLKLLESLINETKGKVVRNKVQELIAGKKYFTAYSLIQGTGVKNCKDLLDKIIQPEGSKFYKDLAGKEKTNVNDFHAYIAAVKAKILSPSDNEIFKLHQDMTDIVDDSIKVKIGIAHFGSPTAESGAGKEFTGRLISHLGKLLPYGISIDEPEKIKLVRERGTSEGDAPEKSEGGVPVQLGQKFAIFGDVSTLNITPEHDISHTTNERPCPGGEQETSNPEYDKMVKKYGPDESKWPYKVDKTIKTVITEMKSFLSGEKEIEGTMDLSLRLYSAASGTSIGSEIFSVQFVEKSKYQDGLSCANVEEIPSKLPSAFVVTEKLEQEMVEKVSKWILDRDLALNLGFFQLRQKYYYEEAKRFIERREYNEAVKVLAQGYLYCLKDNISENDEWFQKIKKKVLYDLTE